MLSQRVMDMSACCFLFPRQVEEGWWEGLLNGKTGMFPSNFTKEILAESDTPSADTPASQEELRSGRTSECPSQSDEEKNLCWNFNSLCVQVRTAREAKAMEETVDRTRGQEKSSPKR